MGIFNNNLKIDKDDPFKYDRLHRKSEIENLTATFDISDNQMVLAINSEWGTGKTSFLKMWNQYLINQGYKTIFFNAWENDYVEEPFIAFVDEIQESINNEDKIKDFISKAKEVGLALIKQSPRIVSKVIKDRTGFDSEEIVSNDELMQIISDKIDNYNKNKKSVDMFKNELEKIASNEFEENKKPIIIFVDELDRCRPDFAISLLERIKHFFNVQNIIFILGIDKEALSNSVRVIYGEQTNVNGYLTRFIDMEYKLNDVTKTEYIKFIMDKYGFKELFLSRSCLNGYGVNSEENTYSEFKDIVIEYFLTFNLSLRDIEKIMVNILMILKARRNKLIYTYPLLFLCIIKKTDNSLYIKIKNGSITLSEIINQIKDSTTIINWFKDYNLRGYIVKAFIIWLIGDEKEIELLRGKANEKYNNPDSLCVQAFDKINKNIQYTYSGVKKTIFDEVELYENFIALS